MAAPRWMTAVDDAGKQILRQRLKHTADEADAARRQILQLQDDKDRLSAQLDRSERSRRRLTTTVLRLRRAYHSAVGVLERIALGEALRQAGEARAERGLYVEELQRAEDELDDLRRCVAWQAAALAQLAGPTPDAMPGELVRFTSFAQLLDAGRTELAGLAIGDHVADVASALDGNIRTSRWLERAGTLSPPQCVCHNHLPGDFASYVDGYGAEHGLTPSMVARCESRMVDTTDRFRAARTFRVPTEVDDSGWTYFPTHVRIERGGRVAPRLHFLDDTGGRTGRVHVGYLGPHLLSPLTN